MKKQRTELSAMKSVRKLIARGWTKGRAASDIHGRTVDVYSPRAKRFCLVGAVCRITPSGSHHELDLRDELYKIICSSMPTPHKDVISVAAFNDASTKKQVVECLDRAIASLKKQ